MIDFASTITELNIPVYFFSGKYDLTVNIDLSKAYLENLHAPLKVFYTFTNSAHSPLFEEPMRIRQIIETDILNSTNTLADNDEVTSLKRGRENSIATQSQAQRTLRIIVWFAFLCVLRVNSLCPLVVKFQTVDINHHE